MADIRIKDLATTATTTASDDYLAIDGTTNGTRKMSAATPAFLTSVTTPSLTSPAATNLTLGLGTGGTALTLTNSTLAATFAGAVTAMITGVRAVINNDSVGTFTPLAIVGATRGFFILLSPDYNESVIGGYFSSGASYLLYSIAKSANVTLTNSTTMTGTTGTNGKINIGFNNGIIYIENRLGGASSFLYLPFGGTS